MASPATDHLLIVLPGALCAYQEERAVLFEDPQADVWEEYEVEGMARYPGQKGYVDYVLFGKDGLPLAVIEAKRSSKDPNIGRKQTMLYADCLEQRLATAP